MGSTKERSDGNGNQRRRKGDRTLRSFRVKDACNPVPRPFSIIPDYFSGVKALDFVCSDIYAPEVLRIVVIITTFSTGFARPPTEVTTV